jgi:hypothetical protein
VYANQYSSTMFAFWEPQGYRNLLSSQLKPQLALPAITWICASAASASACFPVSCARCACASLVSSSTRAAASDSLDRPPYEDEKHTGVGENGS